MKTIATAVRNVAKSFIKEVTTRDGEIKNEMAWIQQDVTRRVVSALVVSAAYGQERLDREVRKLDMLARASEGGEISVGDIDKQASWVERLQEQQALLEHVAETAKVEYADVIGKDWEAYKPRNGAPEGRGSAAVETALERVTKLTGKSYSLQHAE